ncbi:hypothetical protein EVAR_16154_1 [Eumeta japonica]|uniref:Uncharacterized protein n=1 Tax=Eumeta variegata TaxID=151549 RepID=A0A4C1WED4_EUMVA|nr:hypothetical protein EVAR_16154_1 [Eumeta japonica]
MFRTVSAPARIVSTSTMMPVVIAAFANHEFIIRDKPKIDGRRRGECDDGTTSTGGSINELLAYVKFNRSLRASERLHVKPLVPQCAILEGFESKPPYPK